ncbi:MAG: (2Fe-2S) ferredoxin domain-containing protein [Candidatus Aenigmarchaeota archaeon]|nr:(2Fe-2S) ferredoxin domain-containing protein [Candidatus Aenigmarchaeota archaeon]
MDEQRSPYSRHVLVCVNRRGDGQSCGPDGGEEILQALREEVNRTGAYRHCNVSQVRCLGHCLDGPTVMVWPEGLLLTRVGKKDIPGLIRRFLR